jgi:hypothetical protein
MNRCTRGEIDLLEDFFQLNPGKRISPARALHHDYFLKEGPPVARVGSGDFGRFETSHEYDNRKRGVRGPDAKRR